MGMWELIYCSATWINEKGIGIDLLRADINQVGWVVSFNAVKAGKYTEHSK